MYFGWQSPAPYKANKNIVMVRVRTGWFLYGKSWFLIYYPMVSFIKGTFPNQLLFLRLQSGEFLILKFPAQLLARILL